MKTNDHARLRDMQKLLIRDIHDGLGGIATNMAMMVALARNETDLQKKNNWLDKLQLLANEANLEIHELMNSLECRTMSWADVICSIRRISSTLLNEEHCIVDVEVAGPHPEADPGLVPGMSIVRMAREGMTNVAKHARGANHVKISLHFSDSDLVLRIHDNGCGFCTRTARCGRGLNNLEKRAEELRGECRIAPTNGTRLDITLPLPIRHVDERNVPEETIG